MSQSIHRIDPAPSPVNPPVKSGPLIPGACPRCGGTALFRVIDGVPAGACFADRRCWWVMEPADWGGEM